MIKRYDLKLGLIFISLFGLIACGQKSNTAMLTLVTGLEKNHSTNLMEEIAGQVHSLVLFTSTTCIQPDIYAYYRVQGSGPFTSVPVGLSTPLTSDSSIGNDASTWLSNSTLTPITLPVPIGVPLDIAVTGSLIVSSTLTNDGICPVGAVNITRSLSGILQTTLSQDAFLPINLWTTKTLPGVANTDFPELSNNTNCLDVTQASLNSQNCGNLNFNLVSVVCPTGSICSSNTPTYAQFEYGYSINSGSHITQIVPFSNLTPLGVEIPSTYPLKVTLLDSSFSFIENVTMSDPMTSDHGGGLSPFFANGNVTDTAFLSITNGSGITSVPDHWIMEGPSVAQSGVCTFYKFTLVDAQNNVAIIKYADHSITTSLVNGNFFDTSTCTTPSGTATLKGASHTFYKYYKALTAGATTTITFQSYTANSGVINATTFNITAQ